LSLIVEGTLILVPKKSKIKQERRHPQMSRTFRKSLSEKKVKRTYKRKRSLAQQFLDEYSKKNSASDALDIYE
jgi:hypothetical protein